MSSALTFCPRPWQLRSALSAARSQIPVSSSVLGTAQILSCNLSREAPCAFDMGNSWLTPLQGLRELLRLPEPCLRLPDPGTARAALQLPPPPKWGPSAARSHLPTPGVGVHYADESLISFPLGTQYRSDHSSHTGTGAALLIGVTTTVLGSLSPPWPIPKDLH